MSTKTTVSQNKLDADSDDHKHDAVEDSYDNVDADDLGEDDQVMADDVRWR